MLIYVTLSWDPLDQNGHAWLESARSILDGLTASTNYTFYFTGIVSDSMDAVQYVYL